MPQITAHELYAWETEGLGPVAIGTILPTERDRAFINALDACVPDGSAGDVIPEVFEGGRACTCGLDVYPPIL